MLCNPILNRDYFYLAVVRLLLREQLVGHLTYTGVQNLSNFRLLYLCQTAELDELYTTPIQDHYGVAQEACQKIEIRRADKTFLFKGTDYA